MIGLTRLRLFVGHVFLRRAKAHVDTHLPKKEVLIFKAGFDECEVHQNLYNILYNDARNLLIKNAAAEEGETHGTALGKLIRVRQACCDARLLPESIRGLGETGKSPKMGALLALINQMDPEEKAVVFSEWTTCLDLIEIELTAKGHSFCRLDGSMKASDRGKSTTSCRIFAQEPNRNSFLTLGGFIAHRESHGFFQQHG